MALAIISHPDMLLHETGLGHPEQPARVAKIQKVLKETTFSVPVKFYKAKPATMLQLCLAHDASYVKWLKSIAPKSEMIAIDPDTMMNPHTLRAALLAAGAVCQAVDLVMQDKARVVFCNVRPPGHHAEFEKAMGFCFFNNVAVGVSYALKEYGLKRIAIIDFDVHHGNGTQHIFREEQRVLLCSSFQHPFYPGFDGENTNPGLIPVMLAADSDGKTFREKVSAAWFDKLNAFKPELIFFSAGFDGHTNDAMSHLKLEREDYVWLTKEIAKIAKKNANGRMISVLEGGYDLLALSDCVPAHVKAMI